jgi:putative PIN family toxin of toxin-antitoxin system
LIKVVIDTNVVISAALGSDACSKVILWAINNTEIIEPNIISIELEHYCKKLASQWKIKNKTKHIEDFFGVFLSFCTIKNPDNIVNISTDKPDNHFLCLSLEENAIFITGDKLALEFAKNNKIKASSPADFIKRTE